MSFSWYNRRGGSTDPADLISVDAGNQIIQGTDDKLLVPPGAGSGDVVGPSGATSGNLATFNGTTGKVIQDSGVSTSSFVSATATQTANRVYAGPTTGSPAAPTFRELVLNDLPAIAASRLIGKTAESSGKPDEIPLNSSLMFYLDGIGVTFGTTLGTAAQGNDSRFHAAVTVTDSTSIDFTLTGQQITASAIFGTTAGTVCQGDDARLSDARTPTSHVHGNLSNSGTIGSTANLPIITGTAGVLQAGSFGTVANSFCQGDDSRLSDARTPTSHASTHQHGGSDEVATATPAANAIPKAGAGGALATGWIPDLSGTYQPLTIDVGSSLGTTGTVDLNLATLVGTYQTIIMSGNITFTTSNRAVGRGVTLYMKASGTPRTINYPLGWRFFGNGFPATLDDSELLVTLFCFGPNDSDIVVAVAEAV